MMPRRLAREDSFRFSLARVAADKWRTIGRRGEMKTSNIQFAADNEADRGQYTQKAQDDMQEWQHKVRDFGEKSKSTGQQTGAAAKDNLDKAWTKAKIDMDHASCGAVHHDRVIVDDGLAVAIGRRSQSAVVGRPLRSATARCPRLVPVQGRSMTGTPGLSNIA
jgi:hypothetical protein